MAITTKRLNLGDTGVSARMPRKGGLYFNDDISIEICEWIPDTADLRVLAEWIGREIVLREQRDADLVSVAARKPLAASRKLKGSVVPIQPFQASQRAVNAEKLASGEADDRAPWDKSDADSEGDLA